MMSALTDMAEKYSKSFEEKGYSIDVQKLIKEAFIEGGRYEGRRIEVTNSHYRY